MEEQLKKETINVTLKVTEELYPNPKYKEPSNENQHDAMFAVDFQPKYFKKSHFEITGTIDNLDINLSRLVGRAVNMMG